MLDGLVEFYEPLMTLAYLAAATTRVRLGVSVYVVPYRNPVVTAKLVATLDALSGGRVIFGVGVGWLREEFTAVGADARQRGRVTDEYLEVCRRLWRDDVAEFAGDHYRAAAGAQRPQARAATVAADLGRRQLRRRAPARRRARRRAASHRPPAGRDGRRPDGAAQRPHRRRPLAGRPSRSACGDRSRTGADTLRGRRGRLCRHGLDYLVVSPRRAARSTRSRRQSPTSPAPSRP